MPFGLCCAPGTFERLMETVLAGLQWQICLIYLDDIIVMGKTFSDMIGNLETVIARTISLSNVPGAQQRPNGMVLNWNTPRLVAKAVLCRSSGLSTPQTRN
jgi:hypothetical protein